MSAPRSMRSARLRWRPVRRSRRAPSPTQIARQMAVASSVHQHDVSPSVSLSLSCLRYRAGPVPCRTAGGRGEAPSARRRRGSERASRAQSTISERRARGATINRGRRALMSEEAISSETRRIATSHPVRRPDSAAGPETGAWKHAVGVTVDVRLKRAYEPAASADGYRVLVDRLWPRGVSRDRARLDAWAPEVAPSTTLRSGSGTNLVASRSFAAAISRSLGTSGRGFPSSGGGPVRARCRSSTPPVTPSIIKPSSSPMSYVAGSPRLKPDDRPGRCSRTTRGRDVEAPQNAGYGRERT